MCSARQQGHHKTEEATLSETSMSCKSPQTITTTTTIIYVKGLRYFQATKLSIDENQLQKQGRTKPKWLEANVRAKCMQLCTLFHHCIIQVKWIIIKLIFNLL